MVIFLSSDIQKRKHYTGKPPFHPAVRAFSLLFIRYDKILAFRPFLVHNDKETGHNTGNFQKIVESDCHHSDESVSTDAKTDKGPANMNQNKRGIRQWITTN